MKTCISMSHASDMQVFMGKGFDLTGQRFGRLVVQSLASSRGYGRRWACACDCGAMTTPTTTALRSGNSKSCGCYKREDASRRFLKHGHSGGVGLGRKPMSLTYNTWRGMMERCASQKHVAASRYRNKGITVCERWRDFANFLADMGERPCRALSLDRVDNDLGYEPGNCRWATSTEQSRNRAFCKLTPDLVREIHGRVEHGETMAAVARRMKLGESTVNNIIAGRAWRDVYMENR